jgi:hypothetical protein
MLSGYVRHRSCGRVADGTHGSVSSFALGLDPCRVMGQRHCGSLVELATVLQPAP